MNRHELRLSGERGHSHYALQSGMNSTSSPKSLNLKSKSNSRLSPTSSATVSGTNKSISGPGVMHGLGYGDIQIGAEEGGDGTNRPTTPNGTPIKSTLDTDTKLISVEKPPIGILEFMLPPAAISALNVTLSRSWLGILKTMSERKQLFLTWDSCSMCIILVLFIITSIQAIRLQFWGIYYYGALNAMPAYRGVSIMWQGLAGLLFW